MAIIGNFENNSLSDLELCSRDQIVNVQGKLLREHLVFLKNYSPYYKSLFEVHAIDINAIKNIIDISMLPFTRKVDIERDREQFLAVQAEQIVDTCLTSASTGPKPTAFLQTASDLLRLAYNEEMAFKTVGLSLRDSMIVCVTLDRCFMAGLAYYLGGLRLGMRMIRGGTHDPAGIWHLISTTKPTVILGIPSMIRRVAEYSINKGDNPADSGVKKIIATAEAIRDRNLDLLPGMQGLEKSWNAQMYATYASTEIASTFCECSEKKGGHLRPELAIVEIIDKAGYPVEAGHIGEVAVTPLGVRGMPLLRFLTGDISYLITDPCQCGRNTVRLGPILGRHNQMLKFKGTTIFAPAILVAIEQIDGVDEAYIEVRKSTDNNDCVTLFVGTDSNSLIPENLSREICAQFRVTPEIKIIPSKEARKKIYPKRKRKKVTFYDFRNK